MEKINILIADEIDLTNLDIFPVEKFNILSSPGITNDSILDIQNKIHCLVIRSTRIIDKEFLDNCNIKVIATCSRGFDNIDSDFAFTKKIKIIHSSGSNCIAAAEHTIGMILEIFKNISLADKLVRNGNFRNIDFERRELFKKKIGIIGVGMVGSSVARIAEAFGMQITANDIDTRVIKIHSELIFKPIDKLLSECDIITIHIPLTIDNWNFISEQKLKLLSRNSILINTSRGGIVDEKYLLSMLKAGEIKFAGLDVFKDEPEINSEFYKLGNVLLTNHIAGKTLESRSRISENIFTQIVEFFS